MRSWLNHDHNDALKPGRVWERTRGNHEPAIVILKRIESRRGTRYLVQGTTSGRQWQLNPSTLLDAYQPKGQP